jgi:AraC-like DNA-binding protein
MARTSGNAPDIPARYYGLFCDVLAGMGTDVPAVLRAARIKPSEVERYDGLLTLRQVEALVRCASAANPRPDLGFEFGRHIQVSSHDMLGYAMLTSSTIGEAMALAATFRRLVAPHFAFSYREDGRHAVFSRTPTVVMSPGCLEFHLEWGIAASCGQLRTVLGQAPRRFDIYVAGYAPRHDRYRELLPARVHFEQGPPGLRIVMDRAMAQSRTPLANRRTLEMAKRRCAELLAKVERDSDLASWVRMMLQYASERMPTLGELARILHLGVHTLERRLREQGVSFRGVAAEVRHERACTLLEQGEHSVTHIAYELGYRDPANFTRAFRQRAGLSPRAYRERAARPRRRPAR